MPGRRALSFRSLDEVMPEVDRLIAGGHSTVGKWTLGEILHHLAQSLRAGNDPSIRMKPMPWIVRRTVGPLAFRRVVQNGRMPAGIPAPSALQPAPGGEARAEAEELRAAIRRFTDQVPAQFEHPFFGRVGGGDFARLQCIHCAHHLSFVLPNAEGEGEGEIAHADPGTARSPSP